jgi:ArsR family transcriptional regulator
LYNKYGRIFIPNGNIQEIDMKIKYENEATVFKALCDPNRLLILETLQGGEKCACIILKDLNISQSTLSHHMKILCDSGFVVGRREGKWMHYSINKNGFEVAQNILAELKTNFRRFCLETIILYTAIKR